MIANAHTRMTWERVKATTRPRDGREKVNGAVEGLVRRVQDATGLKLRETSGHGGEVAGQGGGRAKL